MDETLLLILLAIASPGLLIIGLFVVLVVMGYSIAAGLWIVGKICGFTLTDAQFDWPHRMIGGCKSNGRCPIHRKPYHKPAPPPKTCTCNGACKNV